MNEEQLAFLPPWAVRLAEPHEICAGLQLCTKDGRRCGNAHVIGVWDNSRSIIWWCLTDAGTELKLLEEEIHELFYLGKFVSDVDDIIRKFKRSDSLSIREFQATMRLPGVMGAQTPINVLIDDFNNGVKG